MARSPMTGIPLCHNRRELYVGIGNLKLPDTTEKFVMYTCAACRSTG